MSTTLRRASFLLKMWCTHISQEQRYNLFLFVLCLAAMIITVWLTMRLSTSIALLIASTYVLVLVSMVFWLRHPGKSEEPNG